MGWLGQKRKSCGVVGWEREGGYWAEKGWIWCLVLGEGVLNDPGRIGYDGEGE